MLKHHINYLLFVISSFFCLNLSHAQDANSAVNKALETVQTVTNPPAPTGSAPIVNPVPPVNSDLPVGTTGKYEEYQSICRDNIHDTIKDYPEELKKKRIQLLKEKIKNNSSTEVKMQIRLAKEYLEQENKTEFKDIIKVLKAKKISNYENSMVNALIAISENNLVVARDILNQLSVKEKESAESLLLLADVYLAQKNYSEASIIYEDLNKITKNAYLVQLCQTTVLNSLNAEGEKTCLLASNKFPTNPFPNIYSGVSFRERENLGAAMDAFKKSITIKPTEMATTCLAEVYYMQSNFEMAIDQYKKSFILNPHSSRALLGQAWAELKSKKYDDALKTFTQACKLSSKNISELKKAYQFLKSEKISDSVRFIKIIDSCGS